MNHKSISQTYLSFLSIFMVITLIFLSCGGEMSNYERGKKFMKLEDWDNAVKAFETAVWDDPDNADHRLDYGLALAHQGSGRKSAKQWDIAAKIGGDDISERFMDLMKKQLGPWSDDYAGIELYKYALIADPENAEAHLMLGKARMPSQDGLVYLKEALENSSSGDIVKPCFQCLSHHGDQLGMAFTEPLTRKDGPFEDYGPAIFSLDGKRLIWTRAGKNKRGRVQESTLSLYSQVIGSDTCSAFVRVGSQYGFPCLAPDGSTIYFSNNRHIFRYAKTDTSPVQICKGVFPDLSLDGKTMLFSNNRKIYKINLDSMETEEIRLAGDFNFMSRFRHDGDRKFLFLSYRKRRLVLCQADTNGANQKIIEQVKPFDFSRYRQYQSNFDVSRDGKKMVYSDNRKLYIVDLNSLTTDTLWVYGAYPKFSPDGKKLSVIMREYGPKGKLAIVDLEKYRELKAFFRDDDIDRGDMRDYLRTATKDYVIDERGEPAFAGKR